MSRTWHHGRNRRFLEFFKECEDACEKLHFYYRKKRINLCWHRSYESMPKYWRHDYHTKPRRAKTRQELYRARYQDMYDRVWPLDKKPQIYYW